MGEIMSYSEFLKNAAIARVAKIASDGASLVRPNGTVYTLPRGSKKRVVGFNLCLYGDMNPSKDYSASSRRQFTPKDDCSNMQLVFIPGALAAGTGEAQQLSGEIYTATIEAPQGTTPYRFTVNGAPSIVIMPGASLVKTDEQGSYFAKGVNYDVRYFARIPKPPTSPTAAAVAGGALTGSTAYYYAATTMDNGIESGPTTEFTATTGASGTLAIAGAWTPPAYGDTIRVYRSAASGGTKQFLFEVSAKSNGFVDLGYIAPNTAITPPVAANLKLRGKINGLYIGDSSNVIYAGGNGSDQTAVSGAIGVQAYPTNVFAPGVSLTVASGTSTPTFGAIGDSIMAGVGIANGSNLSSGAFMPGYANSFAAVMLARGLGAFNYSIAGTKVGDFFVGGTATKIREEVMAYADYIFTDLFGNDRSAQTWQQIATNIMKLAANAQAAGSWLVPATMYPWNSSTDHHITIANQTLDTYNAVRVNYNNWIRNGFQVDGSGSPVLTGGSKYKYLTTFVDLASALEVNAANVPTVDGGYMAVPPAARYTGLVLSGTPSLTALSFTTAPFTAPSSTDRGVMCHAIVMTSGAAAGQVALISNVTANTTSAVTLIADGSTSFTGLAIKGLTTIPAAGDTLDVWEVYVVDGIHPSYAGNRKFDLPMTAAVVALGG